MAAIDQIGVTRIDGTPATIGDYAGKVRLVVNVASRCGYTPQYDGLEALWRRHRDAGLTVLGFPCDQFGHQEPDDEAAVARFCSLTYDVTFPLLAKTDVNGPRAHPLWRHLKRARPGGCCAASRSSGTSPSSSSIATARSSPASPPPPSRRRCAPISRSCYSRRRCGRLLRLEPRLEHQDVPQPVLPVARARRGARPICGGSAPGRSSLPSRRLRSDRAGPRPSRAAGRAASCRSARRSPSSAARSSSRGT